MKLLNFLFVIAVLFWVSKLHAQEVGLGVGATYSTYSESIGSEFRISLLGSNNKWGATIGYNIFPKDEIFVQSQGGSGKANARLTSTNMDVRYLFNLKGLYIGPAVGTNILMTRVKVSVDDGQGNIISVMERESSVSPFV